MEFICVILSAILSAIFISNSIIYFIEWGIDKIKISNKDKKKGIDNQIMLHIKDSNGNEMSSEASIDSKHNLQIVYKIDGDFTGDIKGDNIIVILMNGDVNGDINSKEGDVVLIKGDINGDVIANKVICPQQKSDYENYIDKLSSVEKLSKPDKDNKPDKEKIFRQLPPDYVKCADCVYAENYNLEMYKCTKYNGVVVKDSVRMCDSFKQKERHICKSCYHSVKSTAYENKYYCSKDNLKVLADANSCCQYYDGTGETTKHKIDCARASNNSGLCLFFCAYGCPIKNGCPYKINRSEDD